MSNEISISSREQIMKIRKLLQNPYAYMDEIACVDAVDNKAGIRNKSTKLMGNPYASISAISNITVRAEETRIENRESVLSSREMQNPYTYIPGNAAVVSDFTLMGNPYACIGEKDSPVKHNTQKDPPVSRIEQIARNIQIKLWRRRNELWPNGAPENPVDLLDPFVAFGSIGYEYNIYESLDDYSNGANFKIAGLIDQSNKKAYISNQFPSEVQRFTSAHELGHALMHQEVGLHRDRALDGSSVKGRKDKTEIEADKFAAFFLMPRNLVINRFVRQFGTDVFVIDEATIFALDPGNQLNLFEKKNDLRFISRILANTGQFNNQHFISLSKQFRVSVEAMAIRLEELELIKN
jgi:Zn-dependent peptidase ImmA (M78 family)